MVLSTSDGPRAARQVRIGTGGFDSVEWCGLRERARNLLRRSKDPASLLIRMRKKAAAVIGLDLRDGVANSVFKKVDLEKACKSYSRSDGTRPLLQVSANKRDCVCVCEKDLLERKSSVLRAKTQEEGEYITGLGEICASNSLTVLAPPVWDTSLLLLANMDDCTLPGLPYGICTSQRDESLLSTHHILSKLEPTFRLKFGLKVVAPEIIKGRAGESQVDVFQFKALHKFALDPGVLFDQAMVQSKSFAGGGADLGDAGEPLVPVEGQQHASFNTFQNPQLAGIQRMFAGVPRDKGKRLQQIQLGNDMDVDYEWAAAHGPNAPRAP